MRDYFPAATRYYGVAWLLVSAACLLPDLQASQQIDAPQMSLRPTEASHTAAADANLAGDGAAVQATNDAMTPSVSSVDAGPECFGLKCGENAGCVLEAGAPSCRCHTGFAGDGIVCSDVDECLDSVCDPNATCINTPGSFTCSCNKGFAGPGVTCADIDECATGRPCSQNASCMNSVGSFSCTCHNGFDGDGFNCVMHRDECSPNPCSQGTCSVTSQGHECDCSKTDFMGDSCTERIDDCQMKLCSMHGSCVDKVRDYACTCDPGYSGKDCEHNVCDAIRCGLGKSCNAATGQCTALCDPNCQPLGATCSHNVDCDSDCCGSTAGTGANNFVCLDSVICLL